jgi:hypothetical protein
MARKAKRKSIQLGRNTSKLLQQLDPQHGGISPPKKKSARKKRN